MTCQWCVPNFFLLPPSGQTNNLLCVEIILWPVKFTMGLLCGGGLFGFWPPLIKSTSTWNLSSQVFGKYREADYHIIDFCMCIVKVLTLSIYILCFSFQCRALFLLSEWEAQCAWEDWLFAVRPGLHSDGDPCPSGRGGCFSQCHGWEAQRPR